MKYDGLRGKPPMIDVHPRTVAVLDDPGVMLLVGEGIRKGDCAVSHGYPLPESVRVSGTTAAPTPKAAN